jgi:DNA-binding SARP family transcriptional activator
MIQLRLLGSVGLSTADGAEVRAVLAQPKRLALLAYLAAALPGGFHQRDALLALFWPDCNERQARLSLRQALHHLRHALGASVIANRGGSELGLAPEVLWCDAVAFRSALCDSKPIDALELYRGDLLEAFSLHGISVELERWLEEERLALRTQAFGAASALSERAANEGELALGIHWARRALALSAGDESALRRLVGMLDRYGDRSGALRAAEKFARCLREELDAELAPETVALLADIRARAAAQPCGTRPELAPYGPWAREGRPALPRNVAEYRPVSTPASAPIPAAPTGQPRVRDGLRRRAAAGVGLIVLAVAIAVAAVHDRTARSAPPVIAVGWIDQWGGKDEQAMTRLLPSLLETDLARVPGQRTVSSARLHEVLGQIGSQRATRSAVTNAARIAGATELLEGALYHTSVAALRLDLRRVSLETGVVRRAYQVQGGTPFELADRAAALIASDLELPAPVRGTAELASASLVSRRFYEEGLRTYYQIDVHRSNRFFRAAFREDSTCAMCAYYAAMSVNDIDPPAALRYFRAAMRLASRAPERDRLYIQVAWNWFAGIPSMLSTAESLAARYPDDPAAQFGMAGALVNAGRFEEAASFYRRVIDLDSIGLRGLSPRCRACDAEDALIRTYWAADSFAAAERAARSWIHAQPRSRWAWYLLAETYQRVGRHGDARTVRSAAELLWPVEADDEDDGDERALAAIRSGDFAEADAYFAIRARGGGRGVRRAALWWLIVSLRNQGRLDAAMDAAKSYQRAVDTAALNGSPTASALPRAQVLFEQGRFRDAAVLFDSIAEERPQQTVALPGLRARERCWAFMHEAASLAALGDTVAVAALADSVEQLGALSAYGLDRRLHLYLRGLLAWARHDRRAAEADFRLGIHSVTEGYTRANLQLARLLLAEHRPGEAVAIVQPALRGSLDASNYYVTRTELHEALAQAFTMLGKPDSAAAHDREVVRAWAHADPRFVARLKLARTRLAASERLRARR